MISSISERNTYIIETRFSFHMRGLNEEFEVIYERDLVK